MRSLARAESCGVEATQAPGTEEDRNLPPEAADEGPDDERGRNLRREHDLSGTLWTSSSHHLVGLRGR